MIAHKCIKNIKMCERGCHRRTYQNDKLQEPQPTGDERAVDVVVVEDAVFGASVVVSAHCYHRSRSGHCARVATAGLKCASLRLPNANQKF